MNYEKVKQHIVNWLLAYSNSSKTDGFVVGISGGIDSAVTSTLCALTGKPVIVLSMPIRQFKSEHDRSLEHINWLKQNFDNVTSHEIDLTTVLGAYEKTLPSDVQDFLTMANTRSRIRMSTLYAFAGHHRMLVGGTGNKVEDFGVGFYTKYGDGGVDLSPIADLYKTEVYELGKHLGVVNSIQIAKPTDGLFLDGRTDEDQLGATYPELEWAMEFEAGNKHGEMDTRKEEVLKIYRQRHAANKHKMEAIPVCIIPHEIKN